MPIAAMSERKCGLSAKFLFKYSVVLCNVESAYGVLERNLVNDVSGTIFDR